MDNTNKHTRAESPLAATNAKKTRKSDTSPPTKPERPDDSTEQDSTATTSVDAQSRGIIVGPNNTAVMLESLNDAINRGAVIPNGTIHPPNRNPRPMRDPQINDLAALVIQLEAKIEQLKASIGLNEIPAISDDTVDGLNRSVCICQHSVDIMDYLVAKTQQLMVRVKKLEARAKQLAAEAEKKAAMATDSKQHGGNSQQ
ncbi:hypothetical protein BJ166DRAFT_527720 [Pestalotiopsis sp. NC0098]|nr:hypothetical protein BJ166DRAFT_527720 [Pestalotiopsis sp. NC0098]